jgi:hypothetical protein
MRRLKSGRKTRRIGGIGKVNKKPTEKPVYINLCDICNKAFATCWANPVFAIDRARRLSSKYADAVVECNGYEAKRRNGENES